MKPLPEAVLEFSAQREGAALLVIQVLPGQPGSGFHLDCQQFSCSGDLAKHYSEAEVLLALIQTLSATLQHYRAMLAPAAAEGS